VAGPFADKARPGAPPPRPRLDGLLLAACDVALLAAGLLLGVLGAFLVPERVFGVPWPGAAVAALGNLALCFLGGRGTRTRLGATAPAVGWFVVAIFASMQRPEGDLVIPGTVPNAPALGYAGLAFFVAGAIAAAVGVVAGPPRASRRSARRVARSR
jgi:hypothetical protein